MRKRSRLQSVKGSILLWATDQEPFAFEGCDHRICTRKVTIGLNLAWCRQEMQRGQHIVPDETVFTKVLGTVIVAVHSVVIQFARV